MTLDQITDAPDILMEFLEYHSTVRGHSDKTVIAYYTDLKILFRFLKQRAARERHNRKDHGKDRGKKAAKQQ